MQGLPLKEITEYPILASPLMHSEHVAKYFSNLIKSNDGKTVLAMLATNKNNTLTQHLNEFQDLNQEKIIYEMLG